MNQVALEEICDIQIGKTPLRSEARYWGGDLPWATISDLSNGRMLTDTKESITRCGAIESGSKLIPAGTLLLSFKLSLGKRSINTRDLFTNEAIAALGVKDPKVTDRDYLYWALGSVDYDKLVDRAAKGKTLNKAKLLRLPIPLPPLAEQKRIAGILDAADALRAKRREALAQLDTLLQATFLDLFGDPVTNPKGWEVSEIGNEVTLQGGYAFKSSDYTDCGVRLVKISNVHKDNLEWDDVDILPVEYLDEYKAFSLNAGDVVLALTRPIIQSLNSVKIAVVDWSDVPSLLNQRVGRFKFRENSRLSPHYLLEYCRTKRFFRAVQSFCSESLQPNMSTSQVESIKIAVPPIETQQCFSQIAKTVATMKISFRRHLAELDALFASLQSRAFRGEL